MSVLFLLGPPVEQVQAQNTLIEGAVNLFLDCSFCDKDFVRSEIRFVNYAIDRAVADVHLLATQERTGSGGAVYTLDFIGRNQFEGDDQRIQVSSESNDSSDRIRTRITEAIKAGMLRYVAETDLISDVSIQYEPPQIEGTGEQTLDRWNNWVFSVGANTFFNGQSQFSSSNLNTNFSAARVTDLWKVQLGLSASRRRNDFEVSDGTVTSKQNNKSADVSVVLGLSDHWSIAAFSEVEESTYSNYDLNADLTPAIEFNVFPYSESTRRAWRFQYRPSLSYADYTEETVYGKTSEWLFRNRLSTSLSLQQPWGSLNLRLSASQYTHDLDRYQVSVFGGLDFRIARGLSINLFGDYSVIRDQLNLRKGEATDEEVLLQIRELSTSFSYFGTIGVTYRFGALRNNAVNTRFGNTGGGGHSITIIN